MTQAIVKQLSMGKGPSHTYLYAKITNGNVYRFNTRLIGKTMEHGDFNKVQRFINKVEAASKINLKYWTRVTKRPGARA
tara:strand:+ start:187 stop:423 length:237 start_codon:yes stop_codon:yes gene_type:complete